MKNKTNEVGQVTGGVITSALILKLAADHVREIYAAPPTRTWAPLLIGLRGEAIVLLSPFQASGRVDKEATLDRSMLEALQAHGCDGATVVYPINLLSGISFGQNAESRSRGLLVIGKVYDQPPCRGLLELTGRTQERNYFGSLITQGLEYATGNAPGPSGSFSNS